MVVTGTSGVVVIVGTPMVQVKMPGLMNGWFAEHATDAVLIPMDADAGTLPALVGMARGWRNLRGVVVTVPYKQALAPLLDRLSERARRFATVNVVRRDPDGTLTGDMLDGAGFVEALAARGVSPAGARAAVIGAGGVASAIAGALCEGGIASLRIHDIETARRDRLVAILRDAFPGLAVTPGIPAVDALDLLVNGTPVGMNGDESLPLPPGLLAGLRPSCVVADVVTAPAMTPLLRLARTRGCVVQTGPEMTATQLAPMLRFLGFAA